VLSARFAMCSLLVFSASGDIAAFPGNFFDQSIVAISRCGMSLDERKVCPCNSISQAVCVLLIIARVSFALRSMLVVQRSARQRLVAPANTKHMRPHRNRNWCRLRSCALPFGIELLASHRTPPFAAVRPPGSRPWGRLCRQKTHSLIQTRPLHRRL